MEPMDGICAQKENGNFQRRRLRVAHLLSGREGGGITTVVSSLINNFDSDSIEASILLLSPNRILEKRNEGYKCHLIKKRFRGSLIVILRIIWYCLKHDIDILHTHSISSNFYGRIAGIFMKRLAVITTVHARTLDELRGTFGNKILAGCIYRIDLWMHRFSARIIAISEFLRNELIVKGVPKRKIHTIQHGIHPNTVNVTEEELEGVRRALKLDAHKKIVGIVGRLTWVKNYESVIQACKLVASKQPDFILLIAGDGPLRNNLETLVSELSMSERTIFTGWIHRIYPIMCLLDVLVVSSWSEGFGFVLLEGMACGKAVVATHVSEIPQIVEDGRTGILVPPNNVQALADVIDYLLRHPEKRKEMGERARGEVTRRFPLEREVENTTEIYVSTMASALSGRLLKGK